jgi:hypothetical protein
MASCSTEKFEPRGESQTVRVTKQCGHEGHVGTCAVCQRMQLAKWQAQLAQATTACYDKAA